MDYLGYKKFYSFIHGGLDISQHYSMEGSSMMTRAVLVVMGMLWLVLGGGEARYLNDIHGNTVIQDKSSGFHIFELHGFSVGITSSVFIGIALLICATYLGLKLGLGRLFQCCCMGCRGDQPTQAQASATPSIMPQASAPAIETSMSTQVARRSSAECPGTFTVKLVP